ncbi:protein saal1 [Gouania willdenowi]|uniref:Protein saal1 n=1 Tax=Gouania willdenowi TaxID=441366 RepID=A0A8C5H0S2_GOUWI|nr:protein SAAL1 [Gouania willdenowi]
MDTSIDDGAKPQETENPSSPTGSLSPEIDRNPSPPPDHLDGAEEDDLDAIGETVYSKHWLFSTLTRLINMVSEHSEENSQRQTQLSVDDEEDLCKVWDMAMDKDVAGFLQEFNASDVLLGVIAKSQCPRLTEICVGILGNIACFPETCATLSQNEDLGDVLLLLLGDTDPPTLLETCRLLLTCVSQTDVCSLWIQRLKKQKNVRANVFFIMCSSTNTDLLEKLGELVDKLFDQDEELMKSWITALPSEEEEEDEDDKSHLDLTSCLLEASKQLRSENLIAVEIYLHILHLLTTIDEGLEIFAAPDGPGKLVWEFVVDVVCEDLIQPTDLPVVLHEQKGLLVQAFVVLQALYRCEVQLCSSSNTIGPLFGALLRVCQYQRECEDHSVDKGDVKDKQLETLSEITAEFLAGLCAHITKDTAAGLIKDGYLTEKSCLVAVHRLLPQFETPLQHLQAMLSQTDPPLADVVKAQLPV